MSSVHCEKSIRPRSWSEVRVFSIAEVIDRAWKLPPWWMVLPGTSMRGLSVVELHSVVICAWARDRSSSVGPIHWGEVRRE